MDSCTTLRQPDTLLLPFLQAANETQAQQYLGHLLTQHAEPIIAGILRRKGQSDFCRTSACRETPQERDARDAQAEVTAQLLTKLRHAKSDPDGEPISDFRAYVAVTTYRACTDTLRRKNPLRTGLKNQLHYLLTHRPAAFALWKDSRGEWLCGRPAWRGQEIAAASPLLLREMPFTTDGGGGAKGAPLEELIQQAFDTVEQPVAFNDLVRFAAEALGIADQEALRVSDIVSEVNPLDMVADTRIDIAAEVEQRTYLERLWSEIRALPSRQCAALLLNLRDEQGRGVVALFPVTGVATVRDIAAALGMPPEELAALWNALPLEDAAIAEQMRATRQQVINLRKSARTRLARRMQAYEREE